MFKSQETGQLKYGQVNGLLDKGCSFEGKLTFDGTVQINGNFSGEIYSDGMLIVGNDAHVTGKLFVDTLVVYGYLEGEIEAKTKIELHSPAVVLSNINSRSLSIEEGVVFHGQCVMERAETFKKHEDSELPRKYTPTSTTEEENDTDTLVM